MGCLFPVENFPLILSQMSPLPFTANPFVSAHYLWCHCPLLLFIHYMSCVTFALVISVITCAYYPINCNCKNLLYVVTNLVMSCKLTRYSVSDIPAELIKLLTLLSLTLWTHFAYNLTIAVKNYFIIERITASDVLFTNQVLNIDVHRQLKLF